MKTNLMYYQAKCLLRKIYSSTRQWG